MGHPDWQSYANWRGPIVDIGTKIITSATPYAADAVETNYASLLVRVGTAFNNGGTASVTFYTDSTKTQQAGSFSWQLWDCALQVIIPVLGNFAEFGLSTNNAGNQTFFVFIAPTNTTVDRPTYTSGFNQVEANSLVVPISSTSFFQLPDLIAGQVFLSATPSDATGKLNLKLVELDDTGTQQGVLIERRGFTVELNISTACGERILQLQISNTDGAATHALSYRVRTLSQ